MSELIGSSWTLSPQKRATDLMGVGFLLPGIVPVCAITAVAIRSLDAMSPIYTSERYGLGLEPFTMYKFRTMPESTPLTPSLGSSADPRATKLGQKLRGTHIDEIPNALNVVKGEMSLFGGPRALIKKDIEHTFDILTPQEKKEWRASRTTARPSVFGLFQLQQHKNAYATDDVCRTRAMSDIYYAREASFAFDMGILLQSIYHGLRSADVKMHGKGANFLGSVARSMGVNVSQDDLQYWSLLFRVARSFDDHTDEEHATDVDTQFALLTEGKETLTLDAVTANRFSSMYNTLSPERRDLIRDTVTSLPTFAQRKRNANSAQELAIINEEESRSFAAILFLDPMGDDAARRARMNQWLTRFASAGYAVDAATDMKDDYATGNITLPLTMRNRVILSQNAIRCAAEGLRATPIKVLGSVAKVAVLNTLNRV